MAGPILQGPGNTKEYQMGQYPIQIVDVFAEQPLAGNQLAVVRDASALSDEEMQAIALETNYSETTFVTEERDGVATVRIFTPAWELPFAGHPTIGTAWALTGGEGAITLDLKAGPVDVVFADGIGWMTPPAVNFTGSLDVEQAADLVGLSVEDLASELPVELAEVGPKFVLIPVKDLQTLKRARFNEDLRQQLLQDDIPVQSAFLFCGGSYPELTPQADYASRMFFESSGVREDPATGSANTAFAAYLRKHRGHLGDVVVDQGVEIGRPSRLYLKVDETIQVGGKVYNVIEGTLSVP